MDKEIRKIGIAQFNPYIRLVNRLVSAEHSSHIIPWRILYDFEMIFVTKGKLQVVKEDSSYYINECCLHIMPPFVRHTRIVPEGITTNYFSVHLDFTFDESSPDFSASEVYQVPCNKKLNIVPDNDKLKEERPNYKLDIAEIVESYEVKNKNLFGQFAWAVNIPLIIALIFTPTLVGKWNGMYKLNLRGYILAVIGRALVVVAGYMGSIPLMMAFTALAALGQGPWQGDMNAVIASCSEYTYLTRGKHVEGTMYSCTSLGVKIGGGIGTAVVGWLLELSGYVGTHAVQPQSALNMMQFMYLWLPLIFDVLIMFILSRMNVEETNAKIKKEKGITVETAQQ